METAPLLWGLLFSSVGMGYFIYGKKQGLAVAKMAGLALMVYPYFVSNTHALVAIGAALSVLPFFLRQ